MRRPVFPLDEVYFWEKDETSGMNGFGLCLETDPKDNTPISIASHPEGRVYQVSKQELNNIFLTDRHFRPGDIVKGQNNRLGYIQDVKIETNLQMLNSPYVLHKVDSNRLKRVQILRVGDIVFHQNKWIGELKKVNRILTIFEKNQENGTSSFIGIVEWDRLANNIGKENMEMDPFFRREIFYPGLKLSSRKWKDTELFNDLINANSFITEIEVAEVEVQWLKCIEKDSNSSKPSSTLFGEEVKNLTSIKPFDHLELQLGSIRLLKVCPEDLVLPVNDWYKSPLQPDKYMKYQLAFPTDSQTLQCDIPVEVLHTTTLVYVRWADSEQTDIVFGSSLIKITEEMSNLNLYPNCLVEMKNVSKNMRCILLEMDLNRNFGRVGLFAKRTQTIGTSLSIPLYDLKPCPKISFIPGSLVNYKNAANTVELGYVVNFCPRNYKVKVIKPTGEGVLMDEFNLSLIPLLHRRHCFTKTPEAVSNFGRWELNQIKNGFPRSVNSILTWLKEKNLPEHFYCNKPAIDSEMCSIRIKHLIRKEFKKLSTNSWMILKGFFDRIDLYSVMISGPEYTPYADFQFIFDLWIPPEYPAKPPELWCKSSANNVILNPWIQSNGSVTLPPQLWTEQMDLNSVFKMIHDTALCKAPLLLINLAEENEMNLKNLTEKVRLLMKESVFPAPARKYNEALLYNLLSSCRTMMDNPPEMWKIDLFKKYSTVFMRRLKEMKEWLEANPKLRLNKKLSLPAYPILPLSEGGAVALQNQQKKLHDSILLLLHKRLMTV